ncbi:hypothetical protein H4Q26_013914 [Puccinia striiformis f. sp. tritici PST-130]|nr:hypothetical protein H4Q26_013914 [Puccinia striiformis f. sp. tritici PST-130]
MLMYLECGRAGPRKLQITIPRGTEEQHKVLILSLKPSNRRSRDVKAPLSARPQISALLYRATSGEDFCIDSPCALVSRSQRILGILQLTETCGFWHDAGFNFCGSLELSATLTSFAEPPDHYYDSCPEVVMQDAQYLSPMSSPIDMLPESWPREPVALEFESFMEIEPTFEWPVGGWQWNDECMDIDMVDLTDSSESFPSICDFEMYEATENFWDLNLEDRHSAWLPTDVYMVDIPYDDNDYHMSI